VVDAIFLVAHREDIRMLSVNTRHRADAIRGEELALIEEIAQHPFETLTRGQGEQPTHVRIVLLRGHIGNVSGEVLPILQEPVHALQKPGNWLSICSSKTSTVKSGTRPTRERIRRGSWRPSTSSWS